MEAVYRSEQERSSYTPDDAVKLLKDAEMEMSLICSIVKSISDTPVETISALLNNFNKKEVLYEIKSLFTIDEIAKALQEIELI